MADEIFEDPRLAAIYDPLDPDRGDLHAYLDLAVRLKAAGGFGLCEVRDAPDRPGREFVFVARRP